MLSKVRVLKVANGSVSVRTAMESIHEPIRMAQVGKQTETYQVISSARNPNRFALYQNAIRTGQLPVHPKTSVIIINHLSLGN